MIRIGPAGAIAVVACATGVLVGCGRLGPSDPPPAPEPSESPCDPPASRTADLRAAPERSPAEFTTDGSGLYVTVSGYEHTQLFDPKVGSSAIYVGRAG